MSEIFSRLSQRLAEEGYRGDLTADLASRAAASTDNSIYQIMPDMIAAPFDEADAISLMRVLGKAPFDKIPVTARGGGTGTNGQSLNHGVIVDFRRHMHHVLEVNAAEGWVDVEPGIVLDDLNQQIAGTGLFFAPNTSTSNRCTIGGMVGTDASGKGSRRYGKTADNVLGISMVLDGGRHLDSHSAPPHWASPMLAEIASACDVGRGPLLAKVPALSRRFSGLDLERARPDGERLEWWRLPIGAEGTLGIVTRVRLRLLPLPAANRLIILAFSSFAEVLDATNALLAADPLAIEVIDEWVQGLAAKAGLLASLPEALQGTEGNRPVYAFVEFAGEDAEQLQHNVDHCLSIAAGLTGVRGSHIATCKAEIAHLWSVRSASVGLLGAIEGHRRPISFVEDCVVPPERLSEFVTRFSAILAQYGISYGIYGHADVGCLHTRPALNIDDPGDRAIYKAISDQVFRAATECGGIFWGEHGKGIRGEYLEEFVGTKAFAAFRRIKTAFDPNERFNPRKLISLREPLYPIDGAPRRKARAPDGDAFHDSYECNGNGLCLNYSAKAPMCPSFKVSSELRHSPKGRAEALRALRQAQIGTQPTAALEQDVFTALDGCLGCKSCAGNCPAHVDIPEMKSRFLESYYETRRRPLVDRALVWMERATPALLRLRPLMRLLAATGLQRLGEHLLGMVDTPRAAERGFNTLGHPVRSSEALDRKEIDGATILLVPDPFTALFDTDAIAAVADGMKRLGFKPVILSLRPAGKAAHVKGDRKAFLAQAAAFADSLRTAAATGAPLIGIDPALIYMLRSEYPKAGFRNLPKVWSSEEFLIAEAGGGRVLPMAPVPQDRHRLFLHCTERTLRPAAVKEWSQLFALINIQVEVVDTGCCGMSGTFGHESRHLDWSRKLFDLSWREPVETADRVYATGFSCRCQIKREARTKAAHPMQLVVNFLR